MVTALYCCLAFLAFSIGSGVLVLVIDRVDQLFARWEKRKRSKRVDPMKLDERIAQLPDPVEQAYADTGVLYGPDPADPSSPPPARPRRLLEEVQAARLVAEAYAAMRQYRNGQDITNGAPKEQP